MADMGSVYLFSEVDGVILQEGEPLKNTKIIRYFEYGSIEKDETITNSKGEFHFAAIRRSSLASLLPVEFVVAQSIVVEHNGQEDKIWSNTKRSKSRNSELGGVALRLKCEITDDLKIYREFGSILRTKCKWQ